jgi:hypothetical protein
MLLGSPSRAGSFRDTNTVVRVVPGSRLLMRLHSVPGEEAFAIQRPNSSRLGWVIPLFQRNSYEARLSTGEIVVIDSDKQHATIVAVRANTTRTVPLPFGAVRVTPSHIEDRLRERAANGIEGDPAHLAALRETAHGRDILPSASGLVAGGDGSFWVQQWPSPGSQSNLWFEMLSQVGATRCVLSLPFGQRIVAARTDRVVLLVQDSLGVERLLSARVRRMRN